MNSIRNVLLFSFNVFLLAMGLFVGLPSKAYAQTPDASQPGQIVTESAPEKPASTAPAAVVESFEVLFRNGVQSYQAKNYPEARDAFSKALDLSPQNVALLTNLALTQFQIGKKGYAVALLRRAVALDPDFSTPSTALKFILPQLEVKEIPHEIQFWEGLRAQLLAPVPLTAYLMLTALLLFSAGWILLGFLGGRQRALKQNQILPSFPTIGVILSLGFTFCLSMSLLKIYEYQIPRATVTVDKLTVLAAPDDKAVSLFDLYAGLEVIVLSTNQDWVQITYPGALSGWVPKTSVMHTSGKIPW